MGGGSPPLSRMHNQARIKPKDQPVLTAESRRRATIVELTDSVRWIAKSKQSSKETQEALECLREALDELRQTLSHNVRLRHELAKQRHAAAANPLMELNACAELSVLTAREREVLTFIADGLSTKQIAAELGIAFKTVVTHRTRLMSKLDIHETASLTRYAIRQGLINP